MEHSAALLHGVPEKTLFVKGTRHSGSRGEGGGMCEVVIS